jgi:uncharacterized damage-inducible protein DinB
MTAGRRETQAGTETPETEFIRRSRAYLTGEYLPKILACLDRLEYEDIWWRPGPGSNSVGNLVLHLAGNVRQWVVAGIGGLEDIRDRDVEFQATGGPSAEELGAHLRATLELVEEVLGALEPERLSEARTVQGLDTTVLGALYHVVEHFSGHTAQISWITKMRTGEDLGFYAIDPDGRVHTTWREVESRSENQ